MDEHRKFLADRLLSDQEPITYRGLSRALDVHVNTAKGLLYDFYQYQNVEHNDSIHATYLVCGALSPAGSASDDTGLSDAATPPDSSFIASRRHRITLVEGKSLQDVLEIYESVTSICIYGLSPGPTNNFCLPEGELQSQCGQAVDTEKQSAGLQRYGAVYNLHARLRDRRRQQSSTRVAPPAISKAENKTSAMKRLSPENPANDKQQASALKSRAAIPLKRATSGDIMKSFAKATPKVLNQQPQSTRQDENNSTSLSDDGEADDSDVMSSKPTVSTESRSKSRLKREEDLRRMMEDEDDQVKHPSDAENSSFESDREKLDSKSESEPDPKQEEQEHGQEEKAATVVRTESSEVKSSAGSGRRRGKRRVLKKKRILDDQGYMVTIQEPGWESFSEEESIQPPSKKPSLTSTPPSSAAATKKSSGKNAQGSIMSFFGKR